MSKRAELREAWCKAGKPATFQRWKEDQRREKIRDIEVDTLIFAQAENLSIRARRRASARAKQEAKREASS